MDEIFEKMQHMMGHVMEQGMAYQRMLDAQNDFNHNAETVAVMFEEIRSTLEPSAEEQVQ